jgi:hypothetical protein
MFSRSSHDAGIREAVSDIQLLLGDSSEATTELSDTTRGRLRQTRHAITAGPRPADRGSRWRPGRAQRRHRRLVITSVAVPALLAATAAGWAITTSRPASRVVSEVDCYSSASMIQPHNSSPGRELTTGSRGQSPTAICAREWAGVDPHAHGVPPLVACELPVAHPNRLYTEGVIGVFPNTTCAALHLPPLPAGYQLAARRLSKLNRYLNSGLTGTLSQPRCVNESATAAYVRQALAKFGFTNWRVTSPRGHGTLAQVRPTNCWAGYIDAPAHAVQIERLYLPGAPSSVGPQRVITKTLHVPASACQPGAAPQDAAATSLKLRTALRQAGYGKWRVIVDVKTSAADPCYQQGEYPVTSNHIVHLAGATFTP